MDHSHCDPYLENHTKYTCLHLTEAIAAEFKLSDRWVVGLQFGYWDATQLLQRLARLLSSARVTRIAEIYHRGSQIALTTATWVSLAAVSPVILGLPAMLMLLMVELNWLKIKKRRMGSAADKRARNEWKTMCRQG